MRSYISFVIPMHNEPDIVAAVTITKISVF